ncbi:unnamed protein product [Hymenolepis diminuta]|uniref:EGF-like domain-containing protein n=1 Tax=Hymenolepis diminuta TaxID=6216 RepID=A0A0R3SKT7_HYMDI|nr:unnamed protein product [Hymenolepis diminuta]
MLVNVVSCISQYYGPRCEYAANVSEETKSVQHDCTTGCDSFFGRLVLFSTLGALLTLLMLLVLCLFAPTPIPMSFNDAASVQGPGRVSRVCSPTGHPNSYAESPRALAWMQTSQSVTNNYSSASDSASPLFLSDLSLTPECLPITNRHLPQIPSIPLPTQICPDV